MRKRRPRRSGQLRKFKGESSRPQDRMRVSRNDPPPQPDRPRRRSAGREHPRQPHPERSRGGARILLQRSSTRKGRVPQGRPWLHRPIPLRRRPPWRNHVSSPLSRGHSRRGRPPGGRRRKRDDAGWKRSCREGRKRPRRRAGRPDGALRWSLRHCSAYTGFGMDNYLILRVSRARKPFVYQ